ncbi:MAG: YhbY family RNA-binding protein [Lachnospiraceae bacterium]|nr:YhbY family RNA-binding protein [Lachnospiraceae bacterium]
MTTKQRAYLRGLAQNLDPSFQIGKNSLTPEFTEAIIENLEKNELLKISVLKNCDDEPKELAGILADRTHSDVVSVTGRKIVVYKPAKDKDKRKIELPR